MSRGGSVQNKGLLTLFGGIGSGDIQAPENVVVVNSPADLPTAIGGVRELVPTPGANIVYEIGALDVDVGSDRFTITDGSVVIRGVHRTSSMITSSTSGVMFTCVGSNFFQEFMNFTCPNAQWVDFTGVNPTDSFANLNAIIRACDTLGTIAAAFTSSFRTLTIIDATTGGFLWTGTANQQINMSNVLALDWGGRLFDLGTATFNIIDISPNNRFVSSPGSTTLSGQTNSGNLTPTGRALCDGNLFNGAGAPLDGIDPQDLQWSFSSNVFTDNITRNTHVDGDTYLTGQETVVIAVAGTFVQVGGTNWASDVEDRFSGTAAGALTYDGLELIEVDIRVNVTVEKVGGGSDKICAKIAINGIVQDKTISCTQNNTPTSVSSGGLFNLTNGDVVSLWVANEDSTSNIIVSEANLTVTSNR